MRPMTRKYRYRKVEAEAGYKAVPTIESFGFVHIERIPRQAARLVRRGWIKGPQARNRKGDVCYPASRHACEWSLTGALVRASLKRPDFNQVTKIKMFWTAMDHVRQHLKATHSFDGVAVETWNNLDETTEDDVVGVLRGTAALIK